MRNGLPGYSDSFDRKKQYVQSRLQIAPVGFASTWNDRGAPGGRTLGRSGAPVSLSAGTNGVAGSIAAAYLGLPRSRAVVRCGDIGSGPVEDLTNARS